MTFATRTLGSGGGLAATLIDPTDVSGEGSLNASAQLSLLTTGTLQKYFTVGDGTSTSTAGSYTWKASGTEATQYQARFSVTDGTLSGGSATESWTTISSPLTWYVNATTTFAEVTKTCTGSLQIRTTAAPNTVLATCSVTLTANAAGIA